MLQFHCRINALEQAVVNQKPVNPEIVETALAEMFGEQICEGDVQVELVEASPAKWRIFSNVQVPRDAKTGRFTTKSKAATRARPRRNPPLKQA